MHFSIKSLPKLLAVVSLLGLSAGTASAASVVKVSLWDKGLEAGMETGLSLGTPGADLSKATVGVTTDVATVKAGEVTFEVTNDSKVMQHEMLVAPAPAEGQQFPYIAAEARVDEEAAGDLGEVSELDPGKSGALTLTLEPGTYVLFCNIGGHFDGGMWTLLTVEP